MVSAIKSGSVPAALTLLHHTAIPAEALCHFPGCRRFQNLLQRVLMKIPQRQSSMRIQTARHNPSVAQDPAVIDQTVTTALPAIFPLRFFRIGPLKLSVKICIKPSNNSAVSATGRRQPLFFRDPELFCKEIQIRRSILPPAEIQIEFRAFFQCLFGKLCNIQTDTLPFIAGNFIQGLQRKIDLTIARLYPCLYVAPK